MVLQYIAFFAFLISVNGAPKITEIPQLDGRIVGGTQTTIEEYPYQISLQYDNTHICGGSIISQEFVVTAAHCTYSFPAQYLSIRAGSSIRGFGGEIIPIKEIHRHPEFSIDNMDYDVSVLHLAKPLTFGPSIAPIALSEPSSQMTENTKFLVTGWGTLTEGGSASNRLQVVEVPYVDRAHCQNDYAGALISERMICAGSKDGGVDACQGDSGGPLVAEGILFGIVSWGYGCARPQYPGVYSSVPQLHEYIMNVTSV